jgi:hypothetical protein
MVAFTDISFLHNKWIVVDQKEAPKSIKKQQKIIVVVLPKR